MKKYLLAVLVLAACHKSPVKPEDPASHCRIVSMAETDGYPFFEIKYNSDGNPTAQLRSDADFIFHNYFFQYDSLKRLVGLIAPYNDAERDFKYGSFLVWHRFKYDNRNRIVYDSIYYNGVMTEQNFPREWLDGWFVMSYGEQTFEYDSKNRIIKETFEKFGGTDTEKYTKEYTYNNEQNIEKVNVSYANGYTYNISYNAYDKNVNFNRTNPVFQFVNRDYSRNNPQVAATYNEYKLPLVYNENKIFYKFIEFSFDGAFTITYECDSKNSLY